MTKVLIYIRGGIKRYAIVAPNGVKLYGPAKDLALIGARRSASFQMELLGHWTEKGFREDFKVIGSFMVKHAK